jgi:hypothetical protein
MVSCGGKRIFLFIGRISVEQIHIFIVYIGYKSKTFSKFVLSIVI